MRKTVIVFANSIRNSGRCVAGKEVQILDNNTIRNLGNWIRPISYKGEGELNSSSISMVKKSSIPTLLDVVEIPLIKKAQEKYHPEDWYINASEKWLYQGALKTRSIHKFLESPKNLWMERSKKSDRVSPGYIINNKITQSLYLIKVDKFEIHIVKGFEDKKKARAKFIYNNKQYDLTVTDPNISRKYYPDFKNIKYGRVENGPSNSPILCVSLTPPFNGYHYKVVASVIE